MCIRDRLAVPDAFQDICENHYKTRWTRPSRKASCPRRVSRYIVLGQSHISRCAKRIPRQDESTWLILFAVPCVVQYKVKSPKSYTLLCQTESKTRRSIPGHASCCSIRPGRQVFHTTKSYSRLCQTHQRQDEVRQVILLAVPDILKNHIGLAMPNVV